MNSFPQTYSQRKVWFRGLMYVEGSFPGEPLFPPHIIQFAKNCPLPLRPASVWVCGLPDGPPRAPFRSPICLEHRASPWRNSHHVAMAAAPVLFPPAFQNKARSESAAFLSYVSVNVIRSYNNTHVKGAVRVTDTETWETSTNSIFIPRKGP